MNGFAAELKFLLLSAFEKYQQFLLSGPCSTTSDLAFRKAENGLYITEDFQIAFVLQIPQKIQN